MKFYWCLTITIYKYILYIFMIYASTCTKLFVWVLDCLLGSGACVVCLYVCVLYFIYFVWVLVVYHVCCMLYPLGPWFGKKYSTSNSISSIPYVQVISARSIETVNLDWSTNPNFRSQFIWWYHMRSNGSNWPVLVKIRKNGYPCCFKHLFIVAKVFLIGLNMKSFLVKF